MTRDESDASARRAGSADTRELLRGIRDQAQQRATLAADLLRLDGSPSPTPNAESPHNLQIHTPPSEDSPGRLFQRWIAELSARHATLGAEQLTAASRQIQQSGAPFPSDASFYTDLRTMNVISHAIEERVIAERLKTEVYAGFQCLSLLRPQTLRYQALLNVAECVCVYGLNDLGSAGSPLRHPRLIPFAVDPRFGTGVEAFWFVVVNDPLLSTALLAQHVDGDLWSATQNARRYSGIWTFDPATVTQIVAALRQAGRTLYAAG